MSCRSNWRSLFTASKVYLQNLVAIIPNLTSPVFLWKYSARLLTPSKFLSLCGSFKRVLETIYRLWRSVKYEDIYPKNYVDIPELLLGLTEYFAFYNGERYHQALSYKTPDQVYQTAEGGGAMIVDKFNALTDKDTTGGLHVDKA
jgi:hypothetical protein